MSALPEGHPTWVREVDARLAVSPHFVIAGNTHDKHLVLGERVKVLTVAEVLRECLVAAGFSLVVHWTVTETPRLLHGEDALARRVLGGALSPGRDEPEAAVLRTALQSVNDWDGAAEGLGRAALLVTGAERLAPEIVDPELHDVFVHAQQLARRAVRHASTAPGRSALYNAVLWLVEREHELPHWYVGTAGVHVVSVPLPELAQRLSLARILVRKVPGGAQTSETEREALATRFAEQSEGMSLRTMENVRDFAVDRDVPARDIVSAVRGVRSGLRTSPWQDPDIRCTIKDAEKRLNAAVLGQSRAVRTAIEVLSRATLGLSGVQSHGHPSRPKGILFFAGPTGVGKTELAKQLAALVFGTEDAMQRFDMSEFSTSHTEARLIGSPPGYVGHDAGGELTNAVRRRPFSVLLFDEIEKADPKILDIFLQILEDGRLTDGSGSTVFFGETLIVFTSNLGVYERVGGRADVHRPLVRPGDPYKQVQEKVENAVKQHFNSEIGRPELLNRIGDNIVVFDFVTPEVAQELLRRSVDRVVQTLGTESGIGLRLGEDAWGHLRAEIVRPENLAYGGRKVGTIVESHLVNPLARRILQDGLAGEVHVRDLVGTADGIEVVTS
ncbi:MAG: ATP-dependent Clp protease ATP-binding subunit [Kineosporiaceae bacterium]|nr:ATP-dependent Clp protease ATP-binding subunit [Kineosporiaceae bacterium]